MPASNDSQDTGTQPAKDPVSLLDGLISDEGLRARVRRLIDERPPEPAWERALKHPVVTLVIGFALTWGVGTMLTNRWEQAQLETQRALEEQRRIRETRIAVIDDFFALSEEHSARAFLVQRALDRGAPAAEIETQIRARNEVFVKTMARFGALRYRLRTIVSPMLYDRVVRAWDQGVFVRLQLIDQAQERAFQDRLQGRRPTRVSPDSGQGESEASAVASCTQALAEALWHNAIAPTQEISPEERERTLVDMDDKCRAKF